MQGESALGALENHPWCSSVGWAAAVFLWTGEGMGWVHEVWVGYRVKGENMFCLGKHTVQVVLVVNATVFVLVFQLKHNRPITYARSYL